MRFVLASFLAVVSACSSDSSAVSTRSLDNPIDITFVCIASATIDGVSQPVALPPRACSGEELPTPDAGPGDVDGGASDVDAGVPFESDTLWAFILEGERGDVMTAFLAAVDPELRDADPLSPGMNGMRVGDRPVGIGTLPDGCHAVVANRGSCDLATIDVLDAVTNRPGAVERLRPTTTSGAIASRPAGIATLPSLPPPLEIVDCPDGPTGLAYVTYPACGLVARIDLATGAMLDGVQFGAGGIAALVGPDVVCPAECEVEAVADAGPTIIDAGATPDAPSAPIDGGGAPDAGTTPPVDVDGQPATIFMDEDGTRLYVASWDAPQVAVISLDAAGAPTAVDVVQLEGAIGVVRVAVTTDIEMGNAGLGGVHRFLYVVARDGTVHVVDVTPGRAPTECDTQVDRRFARNVTDTPLMSCFPIGSLPRRPLARGPGIHLPEQAIPLDVAFINIETDTSEEPYPQPGVLDGTFAFVAAIGPSASTPRGVGYYVNVNDRHYLDFEDLDDARVVETALSLPHTLRDGVGDRHVFAESCVQGSSSTDINPPRLAEEPEVSDISGFGYNFQDGIAIDGDGNEVIPRYLPSLHRFQCDPDSAAFEHTTARPQKFGDDPETDDVVETEYLDVERDLEIARQREQLFPDLSSVPNELWFVAWEGPLTLVTSQSRRTGARVLVNGGGGLTLEEPSALLCDVGTEVMDQVQLLGCDTDADCGPAEVCATHPDAPDGIDGMCVPADAETETLSRCRDLFVSVRRYTAVEVYANKLELVARARILRETPVSGCTSTAQCQSIADAATTAEEEIQDYDANSLERRSYICAADESRGGPNRCIMTCDQGCADGTVCDLASNECVLGPIPDQVCLDSLQRYEVLAGEAFTVMGTVTGYNHPVILEEGTNACIVDATKSPLQVGRFRLDEPACGELATDVTTPNPCRLEGLTEPTPVGSNDVWRARETWGVRIRTPALGLDVVDLAIPNPYPGGEGEWYAAAPSGYQFGFEIMGGFQPMGSYLSAQLPVRVVRSPPGDFWVVDSGEGYSDASIYSIRGQVIGIGVLDDDDDARIY